MQLSVKTQNACLAALELARRHDDPHPVCLKAIAEAHGLSPPFLVQILLQLKRAGIVISIRGACGGYRLSQDPEQIRLLDVIAAVEGPPAKLSMNSADPLSRALMEQWSLVVDRYQEGLAEVTLGQLVASVRAATSADMYYI